MIPQQSEKLGSFYLGAKYNLAERKISEEPIHYDARDLTTHAVCVGMTGSGKTGLCIGLLEEAALDKVPAIIIDPKGDMTNLLLQFEDLSPDDFKQWVNVDDANRKGMSVEEYASSIAKKWSDGIADWGQSKQRIKDLKASVNYTIYTPGSSAGIPINIMGSFQAPDNSFEEDPEMLGERIQGIVAALLGMIGNNENPVRSREGILLSKLFEYYWKEGIDLDLAKLIKGIQKPPMAKLGVFDIEIFYPSKERFALAIEFNTLIASPQFNNWLIGTPLDINKLYFTEEGKPRHSIFYIAHLSESERMFFVTLLLNALIAWMRRQSGTTSLRSLLYFDEIFGYFPPTANPPSKRPLLTLLKQARAFGVGAVLVTQNPVDIDYKGLSNAGTWFIGKLQTDRDKMRVVEALNGAISQSGSSKKINYDNLIGGLDSRVFLMHNVHDDEPVVFHTRWVLSYLRGPMTRNQIKELMRLKKENLNDWAESSSTINFNESSRQNFENHAPSLDPSIQQVYLKNESFNHSANKYSPKILAVGRVRFNNQKLDIDEVNELALLLDPPDNFGRINWDESLKLENFRKQISDHLNDSELINASFSKVPDTINTAKKIKSVESEFSDYLYHNFDKKILVHEDLELFQKSNESVEAFLSRVALAAREERDEEIDTLKDSYDKKLDKLKDKIRDEESDLYDAEMESQSRKQDEFINIAETIFSVLGKGRRKSFTTASTKRRMTRRANERLENIRNEIEDLKMDHSDLEKELHEKLDDIRDHWNDQEQNLSKKEIKPRRADVQVDKIYLCWVH